MWKKFVAFVQSIIENLRDLLVVLRGAWFSVLLNIIALFAFVLAPQGKDMLFSIADELGSFRGGWTVVSLLIAILFWSVCSEFTTRMLIYLTDNSGRSLAPEHVAIRKKCQHLAARFALFFPASLLILAYLLVYLDNFHAVKTGLHIYDLTQFGIGTAAIIILLAAEILLLWWFYPGGLIEKLSKKYTALSWMMISDKEKDWLSRLYGMLTNIRVNMPKDAGYTSIDLPRGQLLPDGMTLPDSASVFPFASNPEPAGANVDVWMFGIKVRFYRCLLKQMVILLVLSVLVIVTVGFLFSVKCDTKIGATAIICFAFAAWQVVYLLLHFADKASPFPFRFTLFIWMLICSQINHDHPVRFLPGRSPVRPALTAYFDSAVNRIDTETTGAYYRVGKQGDTIPLIFISAEGGALRTGAFAGLMLAHLQERAPQFRDYIFGYSTVSGGTVGSNFFNAQLLNDRTSPHTQWVLRSKEFFSADFLSAVTAKLVFSEVINYFIPCHINSADRAIALEKGFEEGWVRAYGKGQNPLENSFNKIIGSKYPAVFINTTEVETGRQNVWSNVDMRTLPLGKERDLYQREDSISISYSSAINLSDRFPLISPAGCFFGSADTNRRHFVDGGYYENRGSETLLQVLHELPLGAKNKGKPVKCYVLQFNFGTNKKPQPVKFANEITEILGGIYNTRGGRGDIAEDALRTYVKDTLKGEFIKLDLTQTANELPLNWVLSGKVVNQLDAYVDRMVRLCPYPKRDSVFNNDNIDHLKQLFIYDTSNLKHGKQTALPVKR